MVPSDLAMCVPEWVIQIYVKEGLSGRGTKGDNGDLLDLV